MALNLNRISTGAPAPTAPLLSTQAEEDTAVQPYDMQADRAQLTAALTGSEEIEEITAALDVRDPESLISFGADAAKAIAQTSDTVLRSMNLSQLDDTGTLMKTLTDIMGRFDLEELQSEPGFLGKLFGNASKQLDRVLGKYQTLGDEVDKVYVQLRQYESEIRQSNRQLAQMFDANVTAYHELVKYILAGEQACKELEEYIQQLQAKLAQTHDADTQFELLSMQQALSVLQQRTQDLHTTEMVALQSIPMLKTMEYTNWNLARKIDSAFIITLPVFKQALAQAVLLKRQRLQAESLSALDKKTNEMLVKNAKNTVAQSKLSARLASTSAVSTNTLEKTWQTILGGIADTEQLQKETRRQRAADQAKLEEMKRQMMK